MSVLSPRLLLFLATLAVVGTACGGSTASTGTRDATATTITIENFAFAPETLQAKMGDPITVVNKDSADHSVTAADKSFDTGRFAAGTKVFTVTKPGRIEFMCTVHPYMTPAFIQVSG